MKKITLSLLSISFLLSTQLAIAQAKKNGVKKVANATAKPKEVKKEVEKKMSEEETQKAWMEYATPAEMHKMMAQSNGAWSGSVTHWMTPNAEPTKSECKAVNEMVMDNRYQLSTFTGNFMGMPFEGRGILAFDNAKKVFITTWIDNMGTGVMTLEGKLDKETNSIVFEGKMVEPTTGKDVPVKEVFKMQGENIQIMQMFAPTPNGKDMFKTMEIYFKRG
jgi:Protein of unknown function (DUF1579)